MNISLHKSFDFSLSLDTGTANKRLVVGSGRLSPRCRRFSTALAGWLARYRDGGRKALREATAASYKYARYRGVPSKCNLNAYFSGLKTLEIRAGKRRRKTSFSCIVLNASHILDTSSPIISCSLKNC